MIFNTINDIPNERICSALIGVSKAEFQKLQEAFSEAIISNQQEAYDNGERMRRFGAGKLGNLDTDEKNLFFVLYYNKNYPTFDVLGYLFDMDGGNACYHVHRLLPLPDRALNQLGMRPARKLETPDKLLQLAENKEIIIDATERACVRPTNSERQKNVIAVKKTSYDKKYIDQYSG